MLLTQIRQTNKTLFSFHEEIRQIVDSVVAREYKKKGRSEIKELRSFFSYFCVAKAYKTHRAILILCNNGYGEDAAILTRSLFDLLIVMKYILRDNTGQMIKRYMDYDWVIRQNAFEYSKHNPVFKKAIEDRRINPKEQDETPERIAEKAKEAMDTYDYERRYAWSDKSINQMAKEVGRGQPYKTVYNLTSQLAHSAPRTINDYIKLYGEKLIAETGPTKNWVEETLVASFDFFISIFKEYDKENGSTFQKKLLDIDKRYCGEIREL